MLMKTDMARLEPMQRIVLLTPDELNPFVNQLLGAIGAVPTDQPHCATVMQVTATALVEYSATLGPVRPEFARLVDAARNLCCLLTEHREKIEGKPPAAQLDGRVGEYPLWGLAMSLTNDHHSLLVALGAELALSLLHQKAASPSYCTHLRRDIQIFGRLPSVDEAPSPEHLAALGCGKRWLSRYRRIDRTVKDIVCVAPPPDGQDGEGRPITTEELLRRISHRFRYPDINRRKGADHDAQLTSEQFTRVACELRARTERGDPQALVYIACLLTGLSSTDVLSLPLVGTTQALDGLGLQVSSGSLLLDLNALFPGGYNPPAEVAALFEASDCVLAAPCPAFFSSEVARLLQLHPKAQSFGDLVKWVVVDHRVPIIAGETSKLWSSLSRTIKSMAPAALAAGLDRLTTALLTWDFAVIGSARTYYARLRGDELSLGARKLHDRLGWGAPRHASSAAAFGSRTVLTSTAVSQLFGHFELACHESWPGRSCGLERLLQHHHGYCVYTAAIISFCLALREAKNYALRANELCHGQVQVVVSDKTGEDYRRPLPVPVNAVVREQIQQWRAHCRAMAVRLSNHDESCATKLALALSQIANRAPIRLLVSTRGAELVYLGSADVWGAMPASLRVPGNVGRHFWQNALRTQGHCTRDIDRFMRHSVIGLEYNTTDQQSIGMEAFERIADTQERVLTELGVRAISGLRGA